MANKKRLIDANALMEAYLEEQKKPGSYRIEKMIMQATTVDAVEVVRCKDCKHYHDFETHFDCNHTCGMDYVRPYDFCSYGERKDNG